MKNVPTMYLTWQIVGHPGLMAVGVWDRRFYDGNIPAWHQLENSLFYDLMPTYVLGNIGASFVHAANGQMMDQVSEMQKTRAQRAASQEFATPLSEEEKRRLAAFAAGLGPVDLDPSAPPPQPFPEEQS